MIVIDPILGLITSIIGRVWPDKTEQQKAELAAVMAADKNLTDLLTGQMEVNAAEAAAPGRTWPTWRECIGYICALAFGWQFVVLPILLFIGAASGHPVPVPVFDVSSMTTILMGMLGLGTMRTYEKLKGVSGDQR